MTIVGQVRSCTSPSANAFSHCFWLDAWEMDQLSHRVSIRSVLSQTAGTFSRAAGAPHPRQQRGGGPHAHGSPAAPRRLLTLPGRAVGFVSHFPTRFHVRAIHSHIFFCELSVQTFSLFFMFKNAFIADVCMSFILPGYLFNTTHIF